MILRRRLEAELAQDDPDVAFDGLLGQAEPLGDRRGWTDPRPSAPGHSRSRPVSSSSGPRARGRPSSVETTSGSTTEPPVADAAHGGDELRQVADPILEQVADAPRRVAQELQDVPGLDRVCDRISSPTSGWSARIRAAASRPSVVFVGGIRMSMIATSGAAASTRPSKPVDIACLADDLDRPRRRARSRAPPGRGPRHRRGLRARDVRADAAYPRRARCRRRGCHRPPRRDRRGPETRARRRGSAPPGAIVRDLDMQRAVLVPTSTQVAAVPGVLGDVRQRLGDDVVGRRLDLRGRTADRGRRS